MLNIQHKYLALLPGTKTVLEPPKCECTSLGANH